MHCSLGIFDHGKPRHSGGPVMDPDWQLASWLYCSTQGGSPGLKAKPTGLIRNLIN